LKDREIKGKGQDQEHWNVMGFGELCSGKRRGEACRKWVGNRRWNPVIRVRGYRHILHSRVGASVNIKEQMRNVRAKGGDLCFILG